MTVDSEPATYDYPSFQGVQLFWTKAVEEYEQASTESQKDACEKAFCAATEAVDILLAAHGFYVPVGKPEAHIKRSDYLVTLMDSLPAAKDINKQYSTFKDQLHGICFYTAADPKKYKTVFYSVEVFISQIRKLVE